jgi:hypothetical protein
MKIFKTVLSLVLIALSIITINHFLGVPGVIAGSLVFTAPGGVAAPFAFNMQYLPQFLTFNNVVPLTSLQVETAEDGVIHRWVAASLAVINGYMVLGAQAANIVLLRIANGELSSKKVTISGVTSAAGAIGFYEAADKKGTKPFRTATGQILAGQPTTFTDFTAIWVPTMAAVTDYCEIQYTSGHRKTYNINDLTALSSMYQEVPQIMVNNVNAYIKSATFTCVAATPAYIYNMVL